MKGKKKITLWACSLTALACGVLAIGNLSVSAETEFSINGTTLQTKYSIGETVTLPQGTFEIGDKTYTAETIVYYPNGLCYATDSVTVSQTGNYIVEYKVTVNGEVYTESYSFTAVTNAYSVSSTRSSAIYGADLLMKAYEETDYTGVNGINISLVEGDVFSYNRVIDVSDKTKEDALVQFFAVPSKGFQTCDANLICLQLTDAYNPNNSITIEFEPNASGWDWYNKEGWTGWGAFICQNTYVRAYATGQTTKGIEHETDTLRTGKYGTIVNAGMWASTGKTKDAQGNPLDRWAQEVSIGLDELFTLSYDNEQKQVYLNNSLIVDLDDISYQEIAFEGFTSGEVFLSIYAEQYKKPTCNLVVTNIDSHNLNARAEANTKINFEVDTSAFEESEQITAVVGKTFPLFSTQAVDIYHIEETVVIETRVFFRYATSQRYELSIVNGCFTPNKAGVYTVEYSYKDANGKNYTHTVEVKAVQAEPTFSVATLSSVKTGAVGDKIPVADYVVEGNIGQYETVIEVVTESGANVSLENGYFIPALVGVYTVNYKIVDYIGRVAIGSYEVEIGVAQGIQFIDEPNLPKYLLAQTPYALPMAIAYDYTANKEVEVVASVSGATKNNDETYTFSEGITEIVYTAVGSAQQLGPYRVQVIDVREGNYFESDKYFNATTQGIVSSVFEGGVVLTADGSTQTTRVEFIQELLVEDFSLSLYIDSENNGFSALNIYLTDSVDSAQSLKISFKKGVTKQSKSLLFLNDNKFNYFRTSFTFTSGEAKPLELSYSQKNLMLSTLDGLQKDLSLLPQDNQFTGFTSGKVKLCIELDGVETTSKVVIVNICGQAFYAGLEDFIIPAFALSGEYKSAYNYGESVSIVPGKPQDVLDAYNECYITLKSPSGTRILDDAENIHHTVILNEYGFYRLEYYYSDSTGNSNTYIVVFQVENGIPPTITLNWNVTTVKRGTTISLPKATAMDDIEGVVDVVCAVSAPNGNINVIANGNFSYTFAMRGIYRVRYFAVDSVGNLTDVIYYVTVS